MTTITLDDVAEVLMLTSTDPRADERGHDYWRERAERFVKQRGWPAALGLIEKFEKDVAARNRQDALDAQGEPDY